VATYFARRTLNASGNSNALLIISVKAVACSSKPDEATEEPFVTIIAKVETQTRNRGIRLTLRGPRLLLAALTASTIAENGKTKTKPTIKLPIRYPNVGDALGRSRTPTAAPMVIKEPANAKAVEAKGTLLASACMLNESSTDGRAVSLI
jgi:hypothetical protein